MLTRIENFSLVLVPHFFSRRGHIRINLGRRLFEWRQWRMTNEDFLVFQQDSYETPYHFPLGGKTYWYFEEKLFKDIDGMAVSEVKAMLQTREALKRRRIDRALSVASQAEHPLDSRRSAIPDDLKLLVWERDKGRCTKCGSVHELQFDHIIPVSLGGATSETNLQIMCGPCNRAKSNSII